MSKSPQEPTVCPRCGHPMLWHERLGKCTAPVGKDQHACGCTGQLPEPDTKEKTGMIEIKFRAWDGTRMLDGNNIAGPVGAPSFTSEHITTIRFNDFLKRLSESGVTLMQNLGIRDMNGKEIYAGDLVENTKQSPGQYTEAYGCADSHNLDERFLYYRVAGNIYENPELVEATQ